MRTIDRSRFVRYSLQAFALLAVLSWIASGIAKHFWGVAPGSILVLAVPCAIGASLLIAAACVFQRYMRETSPRYCAGIDHLRTAFVAGWMKLVYRPARIVGLGFQILIFSAAVIAVIGGFLYGASNLAFMGIVAPVDSADKKLIHWGWNNGFAVMGFGVVIAFFAFFAFITCIEPWLERRRKRNEAAPAA